MKRIVQAIIVVCCVIGVLISAAPLLLSSDRAKKSIEARLFDFTGQVITLNGDSSLSFSPYLGVSYTDISVTSSETSKAPFAKIDALKGRLSLLSSFWGSADISQIHLIRPQFDLRTDKDGNSNWLDKDSPLARRLSPNSDANHEEELPLSLGRLQFEDGIIRWHDERSNVKTEITAINGTMAWPHTNRAANFELEGIWGGEAFKISASLTSLLKVLRGGASKASLSVQSKPLILSFDGMFDTTVVPMAKGTIETATPSPKRLFEWLELSSKLAELFGQLELSGDADISLAGFSLNSAILKIGEITGSGHLKLKRQSDVKPLLSGTLAFENFDLPPWERFLAKSENEVGQVVFPALNEVEIDLRFSAENAVTSFIELQNAAGTLLVKDGSALVELAQSDALGGKITGALALRNKESAEISSDVILKNINLEQLSQINGTDGISLTGLGNAKLKIKSSLKSSSSIFRHLNGEGHLEGVDGTIVGMDLISALNAVEAGSQNINSKVFSGSTPYESFSLGFFIANGVAHIKDSKLQSPSLSADLTGRSDLSGRTLALRGNIKVPADNDGDENLPPLPYFVGGTTSEPLFIPIPRGKP